MRTNSVVQGVCAVAVETDGGSASRALKALREEGHEVWGVLAICDSLAGRADAIAQAAGAALTALRTIDEVYPQRPDRG
jgi:orotate phosphoribosyltransferase